LIGGKKKEGGRKPRKKGRREGITLTTRFVLSALQKRRKRKRHQRSAPLVTPQLVFSRGGGKGKEGGDINEREKWPLSIPASYQGKEKKRGPLEMGEERE